MYNSLHKIQCLDFNFANAKPFSARAICSKLGIAREDYEVAIGNLMRMGCVSPYVKNIKLGNGLAAPGTTHLSSLVGSESVVLSPLGIRFVGACGDGSEVDETNIVEPAFYSTHSVDTTFQFKEARI
jgi:hypothetical protein